MNEIELEIPGVKVFTPRVFDDERGFLFESFRASWLADETFVQDNHSHSIQGTLRGLHYQHPAILSNLRSVDFKNPERAEQGTVLGAARICTRVSGLVRDGGFCL